MLKTMELVPSIVSLAYDLYAGARQKESNARRWVNKPKLSF
jgi:hypothetical protein